MPGITTVTVVKASSTLVLELDPPAAAEALSPTQWLARARMAGGAKAMAPSAASAAAPAPRERRRSIVRGGGGALLEFDAAVAPAASEAEGKRWQSKRRQSTALAQAVVGKSKSALKGWAQLRAMFSNNKANFASKFTAAGYRWNRLKYLRRAATLGGMVPDGKGGFTIVDDDDDDGESGSDLSTSESESSATDDDDEDGGMAVKHSTERSRFWHAVRVEEQRTLTRWDPEAAAAATAATKEAARAAAAATAASAAGLRSPLKGQHQPQQFFSPGRSIAASGIVRPGSLSSGGGGGGGGGGALAGPGTEEGALQSASGALLAACTRAAVLPKAVAAKWWHPRAGCVRVGGYGMGDAQMVAVARSVLDGHISAVHRSVDASGNNLRARGCIAMLQMLTHSTNSRQALAELDLSRNPIGASGASAIADLLRPMKPPPAHPPHHHHHHHHHHSPSRRKSGVSIDRGIKRLRLAACGLDGGAVAELLQAALKSTTLTELDISGNTHAFSARVGAARRRCRGATEGGGEEEEEEGEPETAAHLFGRLLVPSARPLMRVHAGWCGMGPIAALQMLAVLDPAAEGGANPWLATVPKVAPPTQKGRGSARVTRVGAGLLMPHVLEVLDLSWNALGGGGSKKGAEVAAALGRSLSGPAFRTLTHLDLSHNKLDSVACAALARGLHPGTDEGDGAGEGESPEGEGPGGNHTLFGLHIAGNSAHIDARGFVRPLDPLEPANGGLMGDVDDFLDRERARQAKAQAEAEAAAAGGGVKAAAAAADEEEPAAEVAEGEGTEHGLQQEVAPEKDPQEGQAQIEAAAEPPLIIEHEAHADGWGCWVCSGWDTKTFEWQPGISDKHLPREGPAAGACMPEVVSLLVSFDGWHPEPMEKQPDGSFACCLMCPPLETFEYFFELRYLEFNEQLQDELRRRGSMADAGQLVKRKWTHSSELKSRTRSLAPVEAPHHVAMAAATASGATTAASGGGDDANRPMPMHLPHTVNYGRIARRVDRPATPDGHGAGGDQLPAHGSAAAHDTSHAAGEAKIAMLAARHLTISLQPRRRAQPDGIAARAAEEEEELPWAFETSLFSPYFGDDERNIHEAFECDWRYFVEAAPRTLKRDPAALEELRETASEYFDVTKDTFKHYTCNNGGPEPFTMSLNPWTEFLTDCSIIEDGNSKSNLATMDMIFIGCNLTGPKHKKRNPKRALARYQFMDALIRIALAKYHDPTADAAPDDEGDDAMQARIMSGSGTASTPADALESLMRRNIEPNAARDRGEQFRWDRLYNEPCDIVLLTAESQLRALYERYSGAETLLGEPRKMCLKEWGLMLEKVGILNSSFTLKMARFCYIRAMETEPDEMQSDAHRQMGVLEFLEAIARVAETKDLTGGAVRRGSNATDTATVNAAAAAAVAVVAAAEAETATAGGDFDAEDAAGEDKQSDEALPLDMCKPGLGPLHLRLKAVVDALCEFQEAADSDR